VVLDLGTGTGILAFLACQAGARRVYAVEAGAVIALARLLARANGFEDRIVFIEGSSDALTLPEGVDLILTDTFAPCGLQEGGLRSVIDIRNRFLKPGGAVVPGKIELFVAPVEAARIYERDIEFWRQRLHGIDLSPAREVAVNHYYPFTFDERAFVAGSARVACLNLSDQESVAFHGEVTLPVQRTGTVHGLCVWFTASLTGDVVLTNRPAASTTNYAQGFFPVARPVQVEKGDRVAIAIQSHDSGHWRWQVAIQGSGAAQQPKARFDHSTFLGFPPQFA
jgi:protein arginine N-methyltransferase 1